MPVQFIPEPTGDVASRGWNGRGWYVWDEAGSRCHGPHATEEEAWAFADAHQEQLRAVRPLAERLRNWEGEYHYPAGLLVEAADRIEELERQLEKLTRARDDGGV